MKRKTKQFFVAALAACILGAASMPVSAAVDSTKSDLSNDKFFEQVQNVVSDYWREDYDTEIRFTAEKTVGNQNGNFKIIGKNEGVGYVLYEINGVRASVRVTVQPDVAAHGQAVRNTFYWK